RRLLKSKDVEVVAINDLTKIETLAHLFKYDSAQGKFTKPVSTTNKHLIIGKQKIMALSEKDPAKLPWKKLKIDLVLECTGFFRSYEGAAKHLSAGAKRVVLSAPAKSDGIQTIVLGVNDHELDPSNKIFSNASCTTNCLAPLVKVIDETWGLIHGTMTTVHAYTSNQKLQDAPHRDLRRARAAAVNIIPTSTGAAKATAIVYPKAKGKIKAMAIRVPVITGSLVDLTVIVKKEVNADSVNKKFASMASGKLKGILQYSDEPLVSTDIVGNPYSSIFDSQLTKTSGNLIKITSWYDNEAGYSARLADLATMVAKLPVQKKSKKVTLLPA
ncbi:MAG TPA: type I glyceraldehyde-3-phosphate dehydrogenase, partial [Phaeodactylibacter sp.]|nr:type I glyceraldehyde-3-phosphate dehydrogenase [Phaeodactylibacter sp.]